jgi:hypothetical protein
MRIIKTLFAGAALSVLLAGSASAVSLTAGSATSSAAAGTLAITSGNAGVAVTGQATNTSVGGATVSHGNVSPVAASQSTISYNANTSVGGRHDTATAIGGVGATGNGAGFGVNLH